MKFSLYSKKNVLDEMQEQTLRKIGERGFCLMWGGLLAAMVIQQLTGNADKATGEGVVFMAGCVYWCFDRSALLCTAPILCTSGAEESEKAG